MTYISNALSTLRFYTYHAHYGIWTMMVHLHQHNIIYSVGTRYTPLLITIISTMHSCNTHILFKLMNKSYR